jgi:hypothetical protein
MVQRIDTLRGKQVALTGRCSRSRAELADLIEEKGGAISSERGSVKLDTDILVRGQSGNWSHGTFGKKEVRAARLIRQGGPLRVILSEDLERLFDGHPVEELPYVAGHEVDTLRAEAKVKAEAARGRALEAIGTATVRLEQPALRVFHLRDSPTAACCICGANLPVSLLVIAHIKRRSKCTRREKLDFANVAMPLCLLGCDAMFERGLVTVSPDGRVVASRSSDTKDLKRRLTTLHGGACPAHRPVSEPYFAWHRTHVFIGPALR